MKHQGDFNILIWLNATKFIVFVPSNLLHAQKGATHNFKIGYVTAQVWQLLKEGKCGNNRGI